MSPAYTGQLIAFLVGGLFYGTSHSLRDDVDGTAYDQHSLSIIRLNNGTILYLREVNRFLALVCLLREDVFERQGLIEYNFHCFREAIQEVHCYF